MSAEIFKQPKATEACLSAWRVSLLATGDSLSAEKSRAHLQTCAECTARVQAETHQVQMAQHEKMPRELVEHRMRNVVRLPIKRTAAKPAAAKRRWQSHWMWGAIGPAMAAGIAAVVVSLSGGLPGDTQSPQNYRLKGGEASLSATVLRAGGILLDDRPMENLHVLRSGDRLRLRLAGNPGAWVQVQGMEDGQWSTYFQGAPPADRWLPFGIEVTDQGDTRLKLISCNAAPSDPQHLDKASCSEHTFDL